MPKSPTLRPPRAPEVAKRSAGKQVNFRAPDDLYADLERVAEGLGLDISNLVRMILRENIHTYVQRVEQIARGRKGQAGPDATPGKGE